MLLTRLQKFALLTTITILSLGFITMQLSKFAVDVSLNEWGKGIEGYVKANQDQHESGKPIALFFYTDWCESCKYLREEVLVKPDVSAHFADMHPVKINPEKGEMEFILAKDYGVIGYPSFFLVDTITGKIEQIHKTNGTPQQFIELLKQAKTQISQTNS